MKADDKIKVQIFTFKNFDLCVTYHESSAFFINFISFDIVYCQQSFFVTSNWWSLQWEKKRLNRVYASDSIQQERLPVSLKVGRIYL